MIESREIDVTLCRPSPTARPLDTHKVLALADSIKANAVSGNLVDGLLQPINVRPLDSGYEVRGGGHRLAAFRYLGLAKIPALIRNESEALAELAELDENLYRNDLTPAERAAYQARRKALYLELHPETKVGNAQAAGMNASLGRGGQLGHHVATAPTFDKAAAEATGQSERAVRRDVARGEALGSELLTKVARTALDKGEELDALVKLSPPRRAAVIARATAGEKASAKTELQKEKRERRENELGSKIAEFPQERAGLIYVDVPRHFNVHSDENGLARAPENHYPTMTFGELCALPVPSIAAEDCILIYWSTAASLVDDLEIMAEWGFASLRPRDSNGKLLWDPEALLLHKAQGQYCSMQVWDKVRLGLGYWFRDRHEFILIGVRGNPVPPALGTQDESLFAEPKSAHSAKPLRVTAMIERLWPTTPKIELFQRGTTRPGWLVWGNQAGVAQTPRAISPCPL
jgi:N6-adenosine-specific RNA methylase IME4